ncbi:MFS transporter [Fructilactobacillus cliffordii]|uniref:MFS transporter n=1 Tax=Fructilactobacillus cliffordii TaxID=2940299 RepID=UPI0020940062|nr:MFS transporter [Fructilactobacillus cliffordii]USS87212.1 MFS transporter [Fructilactobacillus cliffordii]
MKKVTSDRNLWVYLTSFFLYNFARVLPHAVLTVILLDKGMSIGEIAIIQSFFMVAVLLFEFPSGILTDTWSEKKIYLLALALLAVSYCLIMGSHSFVVLCLSWFIYGISSASISSSLETFFLRKYRNNETLIKRFNVRFNNTDLISGLVGGGLGSFIYAYLENALYIISIVLIIVSAALIVLFFRGDERVSVGELTSLKTILAELRSIKSPSLYRSIFLLAVFQIIMQLFFQFWQVLFLDAGINKKQFGLFYVVFQIIALFSNWIFGRVSFKHHQVSLVVLMAALLIGGIYFNQGTGLFVVLICLFLLPFNIYSNQLQLDIQRESPTTAVASVVSFAGTCGSVVSMLFLWIVGLLDHFQTFNVVAIEATLVFLVISLGAYYGSRLRTK